MTDDYHTFHYLTYQRQQKEKAMKEDDLAASYDAEDNSEVGGTPLIFRTEGCQLTLTAMKGYADEPERHVVISDLSHRLTIIARREEMRLLHEFVANWLSSEGDGGFEDKLACPVCRSELIFPDGRGGHSCGHCDAWFDIKGK